MTPMDPEQIPRITPQEARARRQQGADLVVVDVRAPEMFLEHHVPGAISIPKAELDQRSAALTPEQELVFY